MSKHTPGPWIAHGDAVLWNNRSTYRELVATTQGMLNAEANARLIAAAPALLEALRPFAALLAEHHERLPDNQPIFGINNNKFTVGEMRAAVAAIAAAEGDA